ncbi:dihydrolipoyllysine-residue acetyltransferase component 1 of pyruvate dehydrogenase complex, mitochondrial-like [Durio zibethinus]|uniref:Dihydrolipoyllysine-residue acetyltransferase component 1 of pyruvate dehydrogenase complex, mitochondrial-like n=1 Tax=Durio zibethinus TaxID=66656 RepID=A0A6P5Z668_DURZI|nr:dihydrolipoyllysine-residue acetyltransferase component 1 of pyruvate dehydrogenase complex, mitochondrial-like [Durio zibethinus]
MNIKADDRKWNFLMSMAVGIDEMQDGLRKSAQTDHLPLCPSKSMINSVVSGLSVEIVGCSYLAKILAPEGSKDVAVGKPIAVTVEDPVDIEAVKTTTVKKREPTHHESKSKVREQKSGTKISTSAKLLRIWIRCIITKEKTINSNHPKKSPSARPESKAHPQQSDSFEDSSNTQICKVIARRLLESKQTTPHLYLSSDVILDPLLSFRKELKEKHDIKVSVNDIVIEAVAIALKNVPEANAYWDVEKRGNNCVILLTYQFQLLLRRV